MPAVPRDRTGGSHIAHPHPIRNLRLAAASPLLHLIVCAAFLCAPAFCAPALCAAAASSAGIEPLDSLRALVADPSFESVISRSFEAILEDEDRKSYLSLSEAERPAYRRCFWLSNDPTPATEANEFLEEHLRRLRYALSEFCPDGDYDWDDRGEMALRFGIPGSRQRVIGGISGVPGALGIIPNSEIWYYPNYDMTLQFVEPSLNGRYTLGYDVKYTTARARPDAYVVESLQIPAGAPLPGAFHSFALTDPAKKAHDKGLKAAEDVAVSYGYRPPAQPLPLFYEVVAARGAGGLTDIAVNSGVPVSELRKAEDRAPHRGSIVKRIRILTDDYEVLASEERVAVFTVHDASAANPLELVTDEWRIDAPPDTYVVEVAVEDTLTGRSGSGRSLVVVPDCTGPGLGMSDLMIAYSVGRGSRFVRLGGSVVPRPSHAFHTDEQLIVYFELYGLTEDTPGRSRFTVTTELSGHLHEYEEGWFKSVVSRLFPEERHSVSSRVIGSGDCPDTAYWYAVSLAALPEDNYDLTVTVQDVRSRKEAIRSAAFTVLEH